MAETLAFLQRHNISHGYVSPQAIFMSKFGEIKLLDHTLLQNENSAYSACLQGEHIPYIAPEIMTLLKDNAPIPSDFNQYKADLFSLGMTFLYGALLEEPIDCYDWKTHTFLEANLSEKLNKVLSKYPGRFGNILSHVLIVDPSQRPDFIALFTKLNYYENSGRLGTVDHNLKSSQYVVAGSENAGSNNYRQQYTFIDPRVQEVIREAREKNWIKSTANSNAGATTSSQYQTQHHYAQPHYSSDLSQSNFQYQTPFAERYRDFLSRSGLADKLVSQEYEITKLNPSRLVFNRPEVNEIIENVINLKKSSTELKESTAVLLQNQNTGSDVKRYQLNNEKSHTLSSTYGKSDILTSFESPDKKSYQQLIRESNGYSWGSDTKSSIESVAHSDIIQYQKKSKSKEEIIKELRDKYGSRKNNQESKASEEKV